MADEAPDTAYKARVVLVDDDTDLCQLLSEKLAQEGLDLKVAHTGADGVSLIHEEKPDLVLLDVMLPDMNGHDVLDAVRKDEWGVGALIVMLTNVSDADSTSEAMLEGSNDYIVKTDVSLPGLVEQIKKKITDRLGSL